MTSLSRLHLGVVNPNVTAPLVIASPVPLPPCLPCVDESGNLIEDVSLYRGSVVMKQNGNLKDHHGSSLEREDANIRKMNQGHVMIKLAFGNTVKDCPVVEETDESLTRVNIQDDDVREYDKVLERASGDNILKSVTRTVFCCQPNIYDDEDVMPL